MTKTHAVRVLFAGLVLLAGSVTQAGAQTPPPETMLNPKLAPKFDDVNITTPTPEELKTCTVKLVQGTTPKSNGWLLSDGKGQPLRRYFDGTGTGKVDMWSYYKDGVEVYREFDTAGKGTPNNFRWLNGGGMKWGVGGFDAKTGKYAITSWRMISPEEVGFEAFQAVVKNDFARLQSLLITEADMQNLKLPAARVQAVSATQKQAAQKFAKFVQDSKLAGVKFDGIETATPHCDTNGDVETIRYPTRALRYSLNDKHGWIQTGEMIQVGMVWRLVDVPGGDDAGKPVQPKLDTELEKLLNLLADLDKSAPPSDKILAQNKQIDGYYRKRIDLVQKIIPLDKQAEREGWYKQLFDNLTALAQNNGDDATINMLSQLKTSVASDKKFGDNLAAYGTYREMWTRYAVGVAKVGDDQKLISKLTDEWLDNLSAFAKRYPKADDTPDVLQQHAIGCEFGGKLAEANRSYKELVDGFPAHYHTPRAKGSLARLNLVKEKMVLSAPYLSDSAKTFNISQLAGKVVIVHYWSSASSTHAADFAVLKQVLGAAKSNVELVCICLDDDATKAGQAVAKTQAPGIHLYQAPSNNSGGMNSPLALQYGIHILPTLFMVGRDGLVTNNALQIGDIESELRKVK